LIPNWEDRLDFASTRAGVTAVAREFAAALSAKDIQSLPRACRPGKLGDARDVIAYAFLIVRHHREGDSAASAVIYRLASFFSSASIRLSRSDLARNRAMRTERRKESRRQS
jgi:hypothetical protein